MSKSYTYIRCEDCRNHGKCRGEKSIPRYMVKGCMVEVKDEMGIETVDASAASEGGAE